MSDLLHENRVHDRHAVLFAAVTFIVIVGGVITLYATVGTWPIWTCLILGGMVGLAVWLLAQTGYGIYFKDRYR